MQVRLFGNFSLIVRQFRSAFKIVRIFRIVQKLGGAAARAEPKRERGLPPSLYFLRFRFLQYFAFQIAEIMGLNGTIINHSSEQIIISAREFPVAELSIIKKTTIPTNQTTTQIKMISNVVIITTPFLNLFSSLLLTDVLRPCGFEFRGSYPTEPFGLSPFLFSYSFRS